jgi:transposase
MAMGRERGRQGQIMVLWDELPRSPGHVFYDRLQAVLGESGFDAFAERLCQPFYASRRGAPSLPPQRAEQFICLPQPSRRR